MVIRSAGVLALLGLIVVTGSPRFAVAQESRASPFVPVGHWSVAAAKRLHGVGLMPRGYDPGPNIQSLAELESAFRAAGSHSALARDYHQRLIREFPGVFRPDSAGSAAGGGTLRLTLGATAHRGDLRVGTGYANEDDWTGPFTVEAGGSPYGGIEGYGRSGRLAGAASFALDEHGADLDAGYVTARLAGIGLVAGVRPLAFPVSQYGGVVLSRMQSRPTVGLFLPQPVELPWVLDALGPLRLTTFLARAERNYDFDHPWIWAMRLMLSPHERLQVGLNRAVMLGGAGNTGLGLRTLAYLLIGKHSGEAGEYDNQVVALTARYRPPVPDLPLVAYIEWGFDDSAGAWKDVPGVVAGLEVPALPFAERWSAGVVGTWFDRACCGNTIWYRNWSFRGGWADGGHALGHPLGGQGRELRVYGRADLRGARLQLEPTMFLRSRGEENLLAPARQGRSAGFGVGGRLLLGRWHALLDATWETALSESSNWTAARVEAGLRARF